MGAFGFDLLFRFDPIQTKHPRSGVKDLHLFLCDDIYFMDRKKEQIERYRFDFTRGEDTTRGLPHGAKRVKTTKKKPAPGPVVSDHTPEEYAAKVEIVREGMRQGNYYEVVLRQTFRAPYAGGAVRLVPKYSEGEPQSLRVSAAIWR